MVAYIPVGLDVGSKNTRLALLNGQQPSVDSRPRIVSNADGHRSTLSLCKVLEDGQVLVGEACKKWCDREKISTKSVSIRQLCLSEGNEKAVAEFFSNFRQLACDANNVDSSSEESVLFPVISVPVSSTSDSEFIKNLQNGIKDGLCSLTGQSKNGKGKGLNTAFALLSDPAAVCVAHGFTGEGSDSSYANLRKRIIVVDWGSSSLKVSEVSIVSGFIEILQTVEDTSCSGDAITQILMQHCTSMFERKNRICGLMESKKAVAKLRTVCEDAIRTLSRGASTVTIMSDGLFEGIDLNISLSRPRFEMLCGKLFRNAGQVMSNVCKERGADSYDAILSAGNVCSMPQASSLISSIFPSAWKGDKNVSPEEAIAMGCSIHGNSLLNNRMQTCKNPDYSCESEVQVSPVSLGVKTNDSVITFVQIGMPLPAKTNHDIGSCTELVIVQLDQNTEIEIAKLKIPDSLSGQNFRLGLSLSTEGKIKVAVNDGREYEV